jgi:HEXXH motif-containing protein
VFIPGSNDPAQLDLAMRASLAASLDHVYSKVGSRLGVSASEAESTIANIRQHRVRPGTFGRYYKLVLAIESGDFPRAQDLSRQIAALVQFKAEFCVALLTEAELGDEKRIYTELIDPDPADAPWLLPPPADDKFTEKVGRALELIQTIDEALADELRGLVLEIIGASPYHGPNSRPFGSASSLMLWGMMLINLERYQTAQDLIQGIIHEAAHLLLFAHSIAEPLVTNPISERYTSPLRSDPRPMDGVFHATFVSARMYYVTHRLRKATTVDFAPIPVDQLDERLAMLRQFYFGGLQTVQKYGKLTPIGEQIMEETLAYMKAA